MLLAGGGFVRVQPGARATAALVGAIVFLAASGLGRREARLTQYRAWYRADTELEVIDGQGLSVVGLSPFGFDLFSDTAFTRGQGLSAAVDLPTPDGDPIVVRLRGHVHRTSPAGDGFAAYVRFAGLDVETEDDILLYLAVTSFISMRFISRSAPMGR